MSLDEAAVFGRYLLGCDVNQRSRELYARAARELGYDGDDAVSRFATRNRWTIAALDGALAFTSPHAPLRAKLLLMSAILETQPEYAAWFLPRDRRLAFGLATALRVLRAGAEALAGLVLLRLVR
ncbi:MAG: hypothetical protein JOY69_10665 [Candidatus Eremiobacteraeota bacterium]|nr:hypothetical protein [Candidatus Eremiobacteraeota bacterium]